MVFLVVDGAAYMLLYLFYETALDNLVSRIGAPNSGYMQLMMALRSQGVGLLSCCFIESAFAAVVYCCMIDNNLLLSCCVLLHGRTIYISCDSLDFEVLKRSPCNDN